MIGGNNMGFYESVGMRSRYDRERGWRERIE
jgi:hypothetical protein